MSWLPKRCVIAPVDFSDASWEAVDTALDLVDDPSHVHVVHVLAELSTLTPGDVFTAVSEGERIRRVQQALVERLGHDRRAITLSVLVGDPGQAIVDYATEKNADLIVIPSHGRRGIGRLLIGSVAERVVRLAKCQVLVLRR